MAFANGFLLGSFAKSQHRSSCAEAAGTKGTGQVQAGSVPDLPAQSGLDRSTLSKGVD